MVGMKYDEIIKALGGRQAVANITGADPAAVTQWRRNGIPAKFWVTLVICAATNRIDGITFDVLASTKPERKVS